jgi:hypothetical protein
MTRLTESELRELVRALNYGADALDDIVDELAKTHPQDVRPRNVDDMRRMSGLLRAHARTLSSDQRSARCGGTRVQQVGTFMVACNHGKGCEDCGGGK